MSAEQSLIDQLNYADAPRPFKNPNYAQKIAGNRRVKTAKQIVQLERERYVKPKKKARPTATQSQSATAAGTPVDGMDVDDEAAQAAAEAVVEPEVVRKEDYIACKRATLASRRDWIQCIAEPTWRSFNQTTNMKHPPLCGQQRNTAMSQGWKLPTRIPRVAYAITTRISSQSRLSLNGTSIGGTAR